MRGCDAAAAVTMLVRTSAKAAGRHGDDEYGEEFADKKTPYAFMLAFQQIL